MQQVEQGKVDLNADVNKYIDFKIPPFEGKPITVLNLMTHTPGFEEQVKDLITLGEKTQVPYDTLLKRWTPKRIYAPGTTPAYSNYGASLAGYIVQRTSGEPFDAYLEHHIFGPLGMAHSSFRQPLPANLKPLMAEGYVSGKDKPYGYEFVNAAPAGALAASGDDMGRFMIAHLQNGTYNGQQILQPATAQLMHSRANSPFAAGDGMAHGFYETNINGMRVIAHGGDTVAFHSDLHLFLDKKVGIFVSFNSAGKEGAAGPLRNAIFENFADRYFPEAPNAVQKADPNGAKADAEKLAGVYSTTRGSRSNFLAVVDLIGQAKVGVDSDGNPLIADAKGLNGQPRKWTHIGPMLWRDADGHDLLTANVAEGKATRFSYGELAPIIDYDRTPGYRSSAWILPLLYCSLAILFLTVVLWPTRLLVRRKYKAELGLTGRQLWAYRSSRIAALVILLILGGWIWALSMLFGDLGNEASFNSVAAAARAAQHSRLHRRLRGDVLVCLQRLAQQMALDRQGVEHPARDRVGDDPVHRPCLQAGRAGDQLLMGALRLAYRVETHALSAPFRISGFVFETSDVVVVELSDGEFTGHGEAAGVYYLGDDSAHIVAELEAHRDAIENCATREELRALMPRGGARNAVDCAMWELEAKRGGAPARHLAGIGKTQPLITTFTLGADDPEAMARRRAALCLRQGDQGQADGRAPTRH